MSEENTTAAVAETTSGNEWEMPAEVSAAKEAIISASAEVDAPQESSISLVESAPAPEAAPEVTPEPTPEAPNWEQRYQEESKTWGEKEGKLSKELQDIRTWWQAHGQQYEQWVQGRGQAPAKEAPPAASSEDFDYYEEVRALRQWKTDMTGKMEGVKAFQENVANERAKAAVRTDIGAVTAKYPGIDPHAVLKMYAQANGKMEIMDIATMIASYKPAAVATEGTTPDSPGVMQPPRPITQSRRAVTTGDDKQWDFKATGRSSNFDDIEKWAKANVPRG